MAAAIEVPGTNAVKSGRFFVPKGRQDLAGGFSRRIRSGNGGSPEGTAEGMASRAEVLLLPPLTGLDRMA